MTTLPNPWISFAEVEPSSANSAAASSPLSPNSDAAASYFGSALEAAMPAESAAGPGLSVSPDPAADRFVLDEQAFLDAIEPPPLFLQAPIEALHVLARHA